MIVARAHHASHLLYNPHETLDELRERQCSAYQAGKLAWRAGLINGQALQLYNELIRCVGANRFAWIKEDTLAEQLGRSVSTIKRWMSQLVSANLVHRGRRFGSASLTYIVAYRQSSALEDQPAVSAESATGASSLDAAQQEGNSEPPMHASVVVSSPALTTPASPPDACGALREASFFEPTSEPSMSSFSRRHTFKSQHVKTSGGGGTDSPQSNIVPIEENEAIARLQAEGVEDRTVLHELHARPIDEIECVIRYVARCRDKDDPRRPGLIVHLVRRGFGRRRRSDVDGPRHKERCHHQAGGNGSPARARDDLRRYLAPEPQVDPVSPALTEVWQGVLDQLSQTLAGTDYETWIKPSSLVALEDGLAVVATPNIFVRQHVEQCYKALLEEAVSHACGRLTVLQVVIG